MKSFTEFLLRTGILLVLLLSAAHAEHILGYHSDITVNADGTMDVIERIRVRADGQRIRRGIYRDFPTDYRTRFGNKVRIDFDLVDVRRDGAPEPHHTERRSNGIRIYAGSSNRFVSPGEYEYSFHYRVDRMLGYFDDHDELYWNVTGNGWDFRIDRASASVRLPESVAGEDITIEGYTGVIGATGETWEAHVDDAGVAHIRTNRPLPPTHGLTLAVTWPKGHVYEPTAVENFAFLLRQNRALLIVLGAVTLAFLYLLITWHFVGRDPAPGVIFPHYEPPDNYSPASLRYISKMGYDKTTMTTAVLNLAVQGYLQIERFGDVYTLIRTDKKAEEKMAPGESVLLSALFGLGNKRVELDNENHSEIGYAMSAHKRTLRGYHYRRYFVTNTLFLLPALLLLIAALISVVMLGELSIAIGITFVAGAIAVAVFAWLLKAPTIPGRRLLDRVEGFRQYLEVAEKEELDLRNPPEKTPALFESYLPFALALGVAQPWAEQFRDVFRRLDERGESAYQPNWYIGRGWDSADPIGFANVVGDSLNSAISSASTPPGSSSGSSGGGFSGGGGGGGGGGGW